MFLMNKPGDPRKIVVILAGDRFLETTQIYGDDPSQEPFIFYMLDSKVRYFHYDRDFTYRELPEAEFRRRIAEFQQGVRRWRNRGPVLDPDL